MRILTEWLSEMTDMPDDTQRVADRLTDIGLEVEEIIRLDQDISDVKVARVTETNNHPDKRNLTVCDLECDGDHAQVVTAAPSVHENSRYLWAPPESNLPGETVERVEFSGVSSEGMLCSSRELGLTEDAQTLLEIPDEFETGQSAVEVLDLNQPILDIDLTPNRPDCLSHLGVARDYAAAEGLDLIDPRPQELSSGPETDVNITIESPEDCWSYTGVPVGGVNVTSSPFSIQKRILKMGLRPLNNIVDVTNYTLFEVGHPLHPFDYDRMLDPVTIRRADSDEQIRTLDGETQDLTGDDLVIADKQGPQALAGIMGGAQSQVEQRSERILLEGAYFNPTRIRQTASRLKLHTEASHRFERGTDDASYERCMARCLQLMSDDPAHGDDLTIFEPEQVTENTSDSVLVSFSPDEFPNRVGFDPGTDSMKDQLRRLGISIEDDNGSWQLEPPSWRVDLSRTEDIVEEIVRLHGYEKIPTDSPTLNLDQTIKPAPDQYETIREFLISAGFYEVITYCFVDPSNHSFSDSGEPLSLENPLSEHTETMRQSILDGLLDTLDENLDHNRYPSRFFELGHVFPPDKESEPRMLSFVMTGQRDNAQWTGETFLDFYDGSGLVRALFERLGISDVTLEPSKAIGFHDNRTAQVMINNNSLGVVGQIDTDQFDISPDGSIIAGELELSNFPTPPSPHYERFSKQPISKLDMDIVVDRDSHVQPLKETITETTQWLENIRIFDVYEGDPLPENKKSISFNFSFRHPERTLNDEEINDIQNKIFSALNEEHGAELRSE